MFSCLLFCSFLTYTFYVFFDVHVSGLVFFFFQAEDGIRDAQESRGLGDVYKRQGEGEGEGEGEVRVQQEAQMRRQFETQLLDSAATVRKLVSENQRLKQSVDEFQRVAEENDMLWCSIKEFGEAVEGQGRYVRTAANAILLDPNS
eukprot:TRINITY_DN12633_c0_g1_i11.p1 TRINITY_DN12633_c0_g1~~TRINITY_DN12633_c0_g1_i11.p1  ORF type:complete len:146 (-),score=32.96 TRINITY_DN12633_c0_g1_i11:464-901(-)